jgi:hypothetical protein
MHNPDIEKFDSFLKQQLNHVEVDQSMAEVHMNEMNFPVVVEAASTTSFWEKILGNKKFFFWMGAILTVAIMVILLFNNTTTDTSETEKSTETATKTESTPKMDNTQRTNVNTNSIQSFNNNALQNNSRAANNESVTNTTTIKNDGKTIAYQPSLELTTNGHRNKDKKIIITNKSIQLDTGTMDNTKAEVSKIITKADTAVKRPEVKKVATPKDSTYIIW